MARFHNDLDTRRSADTCFFCGKLLPVARIHGQVLPKIQPRPATSSCFSSHISQVLARIESIVGTVVTPGGSRLVNLIRQISASDQCDRILRYTGIEAM
jgi:hypothetical protein